MPSVLASVKSTSSKMMPVVDSSLLRRATPGGKPKRASSLSKNEVLGFFSCRAGTMTGAPYRKRLNERDLHPDPLEEFHRWFARASSASRDPNRMVLATATLEGR